MTKTYSQKTLFAIIDLANTYAQQKAVAKYATNLANHLGMPVVLYPKRDGKMSALPFRRVINAARKISTTEVRISKLKINPLSIFSSIQDIAEQERAAFIVMTLDRSSLLFFGKTAWTTPQNMTIPTILLPNNAVFTPLKHITIAVDGERKVQKLNTVYMLAKAFDATIHIFVENAETKNTDEQFIIYKVKDNTTKHLQKYGINYTIETARKTKNFAKHFCKYSAKNADALVIEVDPGKIPSVVKQNIETLLSIDTYAQPVILTKTKETGRYGTFN